jgi:hypothetical protein
VSNTVVGVVILAAGAFGALSERIGLAGLVRVFAVASAAAVFVGSGTRRSSVDRNDPSGALLGGNGDSSAIRPKISRWNGSIANQYNRPARPRGRK